MVKVIGEEVAQEAGKQAAKEAAKEATKEVTKQVAAKSTESAIIAFGGTATNFIAAATGGPPAFYASLVGTSTALLAAETSKQAVIEAGKESVKKASQEAFKVAYKETAKEWAKCAATDTGKSIAKVALKTIIAKDAVRLAVQDNGSDSDDE